MLSSAALMAGMIVVGAGSPAGAAEAAPSPPADPPNIVLIIADDLGYGDVGCYNPNSKIATPRLDRLAREGVRLTDAHSASAVCTPSRYAVLTGRYCWRTRLKRGVLMGFDPPLIEPGRLTIGGLLAEAGYRTAAIGKWHVGMSFTKTDGQEILPGQGGIKDGKRIDFSVPVKNSPLDAGFHRFFGCSACPTTDWIYSYFDGNRPTQSPSDSFAGFEGFWEWNRPGVKSPDFEFENVDLRFSEASVRFIQEHVKSDPGKPFFLYHAASACHLPAIPAQRFSGASKVGPLGDLITEFDWVVGEILDALERTGVARNTLVIVTSDNGPETCCLRLKSEFGHDSAGGLRGLKRDNWEGGHRVPFIARWPARIEPGRVEDSPVCLTDLFATAASLAGRPVPEEAGEDSVDIASILLGAPKAGQSRSGIVHHSADGEFAIRVGDWKLMDHKESGGWNYRNGEIPIEPPLDDPESAGQLYNLKEDPAERTNLYRKRPEIVERLRRQLETYKADGRSVPADRGMHGATR